MGLPVFIPRINQPLAPVLTDLNTPAEFLTQASIVGVNDNDRRVFVPGRRYDSGIQGILSHGTSELIRASNDNGNSGIIKIGAMNLSLFGRLGQKGPHREPTSLYLKDFERLPGEHGILEYLRSTSLDVIGLSEVWDPEIQMHISRELKDIYPYTRVTPWELGIASAVRHIGKKLKIEEPKIEKASDILIEKVSRLHYDPSTIVSLMSAFIDEDIAARILKYVLRAPHIFGAGLMVLSKHPFVDWDTHFHPFEHQADLDNFTRKGIMHTCVDLPDIGEVNFLLTHLQEGPSRKAKNTRYRQLQMMRRLIDQSDFPTIALGDFNITREKIDMETANLVMTEEYERMLEVLRLRDAYRAVHRAPNDHPGDTYHYGPYAQEKGIPADADDYAIAVDYILHDRNFEVLAAVVDKDNFFNDELGIPNSDHSPLIAAVRRRHAPRRMATG